MLNKLNQEQLNQTVTVHHHFSDEYYPINHFAITFNNDVLDDVDLIQNEQIKNNVQSKSIIELGISEIVSIQKILSTHSETILFSGFGNKFPNEDKLDKFNILCILS